MIGLNFDWTVSFGNVLQILAFIGTSIVIACTLGAKIARSRIDETKQLASMESSIESLQLQVRALIAANAQSRTHFDQRHSELIGRVDALEGRVTALDTWSRSKG